MSDEDAAIVDVFRSHSSVEVTVVRGLLAAHGVDAVISPGLVPSLPPMLFGHAEFRVSVPGGDADRARDILASHLDEAAAAEVRRLSETLGPLEKTIGHDFRDLGLLEHALTHRSRAHEDASGGVIDNESLEFLGDAVLGFVVADLLFARFPTHTEGYKSKVKAGVVSAAALSRLAEEIDLGRYVLLGRGEEKTGGRHKQAILADCFEAVIAAVYLDGGIEAAREFVVARLDPLIGTAGEQVADAVFTSDWKSALQERLQAAGQGLPVYRVAATDGPDHRKQFHVEVSVGGEVLSRGEGRSKKEAEQGAARDALTALRAARERDGLEG